MIIGSYVKLPIGCYGKVKITDNRGQIDHTWRPIIVVREATRDEYLEQCRELDAVPNAANDDEFFYKVLTD